MSVVSIQVISVAVAWGCCLSAMTYAIIYGDD